MAKTTKKGVNTQVIESVAGDTVPTGTTKQTKPKYK